MFEFLKNFFRALGLLPKEADKKPSIMEVMQGFSEDNHGDKISAPQNNEVTVTGRGGAQFVVQYEENKVGPLVGPPRSNYDNISSQGLVQEDGPRKEGTYVTLAEARTGRTNDLQEPDEETYPHSGPRADPSDPIYDYDKVSVAPKIPARLPRPRPRDGMVVSNEVSNEVSNDYEEPTLVEHLYQYQIPEEALAAARNPLPYESNTDAKGDKPEPDYAKLSEILARKREGRGQAIVEFLRDTDPKEQVESSSDYEVPVDPTFFAIKQDEVVYNAPVFQGDAAAFKAAQKEAAPLVVAMQEKRMGTLLDPSGKGGDPSKLSSVNNKGNER